MGFESLQAGLQLEGSLIAAHIFSPVELKFTIDYDRMRTPQDLDRARVAAMQITRQR